MPEPTRTVFDRELADLDADLACLAARVGQALAGLQPVHHLA